MQQWYRSGFTIIELLIVIVIIAILAAITIVAYNGITGKANAVSAQAAARQAYEAVVAYMATNADQVPTTLAAANINNQGNTSYQYSYNNTVSPQTFCLTATTANVSYYADNGSHTTPAAGACAGQAPNGGTVVTNLVFNPKLGNSMSMWHASAPGLAGSASRQTVGGPSETPFFFRFSSSTTPTGSPLSIYPTNGGTVAFPVTVGSTYTISAFLRTSCTLTGSSGVRVDAIWYSSNGSSDGTTTAPANTPNSANNWQRVSQTVTAPAGAAYILPAINFSGETSCPSTSTYDATAVMVTPGSTLYNYADGDSPGWAWTGDPNSSTSTGPAL